jgi:hypothetical protein
MGKMNHTWFDSHMQALMTASDTFILIRMLASYILASLELTSVLARYITN